MLQTLTEPEACLKLTPTVLPSIAAVTKAVAAAAAGAPACAVVAP
jgi:hypothetical protein